MTDPTESGNPGEAMPGSRPAAQHVIGLDQAQQATQGQGSQVNVFMQAMASASKKDAVDDGQSRVWARRTSGMPRVWNLEPRNPGFTGRDALLVDLRQKLCAGGAMAVQVIHGRSGVGKTQLALEYAHRYSDDYEVVWWITAEQAGLIDQQYAILGAELGVVGPEAKSRTDLAADSSVDAEANSLIATAVKACLRSHDRWLLIFDHAESPYEIRRWLPGGSGHVIITSRRGRWAQVAKVIEVDVMHRSESVTLLTDHHPGLNPTDADLLAAALGDLPLALTQAASFLAETATSPIKYLDLLHTNAAEILHEGQPAGYRRSLAAAIILTTDRLATIDPAALAIMRVCAFLAPEPIPVELFTAAVGLDTGDDLPVTSALAAIADKPVALRRSIGRITDYGLAIASTDAITLHRLTQAILRDNQPPTIREAIRRQVETLVIAARPGNAQDRRRWPVWNQLVPHILALYPATTANADLRDLACDMVWYLLYRGDSRTGATLATKFHSQWLNKYGPDDRNTLEAATARAKACRDLGDYVQARQLDEDAYERRRRICGDDNPDTLAVANNLALDLRALGDVEAARRLDEDTLARHRRLHGNDDPNTLISAANLAVDLRKLGQVHESQRLAESSLLRMRRVFGDDHIITLRIADYVAADLRALGKVEAARNLDEDTLTRMRQVLGENHPLTLRSANNLSDDMRALGDVEAARQLDQETLTRQRRVLGDEHPHTLRTAKNLEDDLRLLDRLQSDSR